MIKIEAQTCQSAEDIHPLWRDLTRPARPRYLATVRRGLREAGYEGKVFELRTTHLNEPVGLGYKVAALPRSDYSTIKGGFAPKLKGSVGRVYVEHGEYYPATFGLHWVEVV